MTSNQTLTSQELSDILNIIDRALTAHRKSEDEPALFLSFTRYPLPAGDYAKLIVERSLKSAKELVMEDLSIYKELLTEDDVTAFISQWARNHILPYVPIFKDLDMNNRNEAQLTYTNHEGKMITLSISNDGYLTDFLVNRMSIVEQHDRLLSGQIFDYTLDETLNDPRLVFNHNPEIRQKVTELYQREKRLIWTNFNVDICNIIC